MHFIEVRQVAQNQTALVMKEGKLKSFKSEKTAREWGRKNIEGAMFLASWVPITLQEAKRLGHEVTNI